MTKQIQKSGGSSGNLQVGRDLITAHKGSSIAIYEKDEPEGLIKEIYNDLAKPGVTQVGKAIGDTLGLFHTMLPVGYLNKSAALIYKNNLEKLRNKLEEEKTENIQSVPPETGKPLLERLLYTSNDDLVELFANLLARASRKDESHLAHPSFVNIISSLSPDEARIINYMSDNSLIRCISLRWEKNDEDHGGVSTVTYQYTHRGLTALESKIEILFPENFYMYFTNMMSLGIIQFQEDTTLDEYLTPSDEYSEIKEFYGEKIYEGMFDEHGYESRIMMGRVDLTELGEMFVKACTDYKEFEASKTLYTGTSVNPDKLSEDDIVGITKKLPDEKGNVNFTKSEW